MPTYHHGISLPAKNKVKERVVETVEEIIEVAINRGTREIKVVSTDTIKALYAPMPITGLSVSFLVQVLEPVPSSPRVVQLSLLYTGTKKDPVHCLGEQLVQEWHDQLRMFGGYELAKEAQWMRDVNKVNLIECDLLNPKKKEE